MMGVAYDSTILTLRAIVGNDDASIYAGRLYGDTSAAIEHATAQGARVLNGSYGPLTAPVHQG